MVEQRFIAGVLLENKPSYSRSGLALRELRNHVRQEKFFEPYGESKPFSFLPSQIKTIITVNHYLPPGLNSSTGRASVDLIHRSRRAAGRTDVTV